jgi:hypothetical protein
MKIFYSIFGLVISLGISYKYIYNTLYNRLLFVNLSQEQYLIFCKTIFLKYKNDNLNKIYQIVIDDNYVELPIQKFKYIYEKENFIFHPIIENNSLLGYDIEYNIYKKEFLNKFINYVLNKKII